MKKGMAEQKGQKHKVRDLEVITTHVNADYDAFASMLAASRLYPDALLILPGSQERNLRNFFVASATYMYNFAKVKDLEFDRVKRLIMVDTRQKDRIGALSALADDPEVDIHAYDHHPDSDTDAAASRQVVERVGSTVTVLSRLLQEAGVELSDDEATLMALGIYEDTGGFTFNSTTERDFLAAAWLLSQGANLNLVSELTTRELTADEVGLLNDLIREARTFKLGDVEVVISTVSRQSYVPELAVLVHRFMEMENLDAFFALARLEGKIYLVARSRVPEVDAGLIAAAFGGGGHPSAASASLKDMTLIEAKERLRGVLEASVNPTRTARDLMTGPVVSVGPKDTLDHTHEVMNRYGLGILPVMESSLALGIISLEIVEKAIFHGLGLATAGDYMDRRVITLDVDDSLADVEQALVGERRLMVPVGQNGKVVGVITRDDYLNNLVEDPALKGRRLDIGRDDNQHRRKNIASLMRERLSPEVVAVLRDLGETARSMGQKAYLVGGCVRDIYLRRKTVDLDLVVEGDAMALAHRLAEKEPGIKVKTHKKFNTAKLKYPDGLDMDLATARLEYYQAPAALPVVEISSLKLDLYRRDFTINTLAVSLCPGEFGQVLDYFDGLRDLKGKTVRVLHNLSFVEDPTRIFRAVRFEQRFGFRIGRFTEGLIKNALKTDALEKLSGTRLFGEFGQMMEEERAGACIMRMEELKLLSVFHEKLEKLDERQIELVEEVEQALAWYRLSFLDRPVRKWLVYILALGDGFKDKELNSLMDRIALAPRVQNEIREMRVLALKALNILQRNHPKNSEIWKAMHVLRPSYQIFVMAKGQKQWVQKAVSRYLIDLDKIRPSLDGDHLRELGFAPGPIYKRILDRVHAARLDGEVRSLAEEKVLALTEFGALRL